jgi:hypothetical protein
LLQFGNETVGAVLPAWVSTMIHEVVYGMLAHAQLTIRENATRVFSAFLSRSQFKVSQSIISVADSCAFYFIVNAGCD